MQHAIEFLQVLAAISWPAMVAYVFWTYRKQVADLIDSAKTRKFTIEVGGQKLSMEEASHQQQSLIGDLQKQLLELRKKVEGFAVSPEAQLAQPIAEPSAPTPNNSVLWVDDSPKNNSYFIELLQRRGYRVDLADSTADGLARLDRQKYRLVLSDMSRREDGRFNGGAGLDLLEEMIKKGLSVPFVVFCSSNGVRRFRDKVKELGGRAITSSGTELRAILDEIVPENVG